MCIRDRKITERIDLDTKILLIFSPVFLGSGHLSIQHITDTGYHKTGDGISETAIQSPVSYTHLDVYKRQIL